MKILKGVCVYSLIILAMLLIVGILLFAAMFVKPDFGVFGYRVANNSKLKKEEVSVELKDNSNINHTEPLNITIKTQGHSVLVEYVTDSTTRVLINKTDDMFGLYKYKKSYLSKIIPVVENNSIIINADGLNGAVAYRDSVVRVRLPKHKQDGLALTYNLTIKTNSGNVKILGTSDNKDIANMKVNKLNVETTRGNATVGGLRETELATVTGGAVVSTEKYLFLEALNLKTLGGIFDFKAFDNVVTAKDDAETTKIGDITYNTKFNYTKIYKANIISHKGDYLFNNLAGKLNISGSDILLKAKNITTFGKGFYFNAPNGIFEIKSLDNTPFKNDVEPEQGITIITNNIDINIGKILGEASIKSEYGQIKITEELSSRARIQSKHGDIFIKNALNTISVTNEYGNIDVEKFSGKIYILNKQGSINVNYDTTKFAKLESVKLESEIINTNGNITANGLMNQTKLTSLGNANITANFKEMPAFETNKIKHEVTVNGGKANLSMPATQAFYLYNYSVGGSIGGKVGTTTIQNVVNDSTNNLPQQIVSPIIDTNPLKNTTIVLIAKGGSINLSTKN